MSRNTKNVLSAIQAGQIEVDTELTLPKRAAQVLAAAAKEYPYQTIPWKYLYKASTGQKAVPMEKANEVVHLQKRSQKIREILEKEYGRGLIPEANGVRASVDSDDFMQRIVTPSTRRMLTTQARLQQRLRLVDANSLKLPDNVNLYKRITKGMRELNGLNLPQRFQLVPKPEVVPTADAET